MLLKHNSFEPLGTWGNHYEAWTLTGETDMTQHRHGDTINP